MEECPTSMPDACLWPKELSYQRASRVVLAVILHVIGQFVPTLNKLNTEVSGSLS